MGCYYLGDIEGKFWFGLQSSDAADRFGSEGVVPNRLEYWFDEDHLPEVESEILSIETSLGEKKQIIDKFFEDNNGWNDKMLEEAGISQEELSEYADLGLGIKIRDCIKEFGHCSFEAEL